MENNIIVSWKNQYPGVDWAVGANNGYPSNNVNILRVDLTYPGIEFFTTPWTSLRPPPPPLTPIQNNGMYGGVKTTQFLQEHFNTGTMEAMFATNANYFCMADRNIAYGLSVSKGRMVMYPYSAKSPYGLIITADNFAIMGDVAILFDQFADKIGKLAGKRHKQNPAMQPWTAVAGNVYLVQNGKYVPPDPSVPLDDPTIAARTAIGISAPQLNGMPRYIYLLTIDGVEVQTKKPYYGATYEDAAAWLIAAGASEGFNLDGGGSTTMAKISSGNPVAQLMNLPHDNEQSFSVQERYVAISFGVIVNKINTSAV